MQQSKYFIINKCKMIVIYYKVLAFQLHFTQQNCLYNIEAILSKWERGKVAKSNIRNEEEKC